MTPEQSDESGFTLLELLIAIAVTSIILTPLFSSFVFTLGQTGRSEQEVTNSADAQALSAYLPQDVANSDTVGASSTCGAGSPILRLTWDDGAAVHHVAYKYSTTSVQGVPAYQVTRFECSGASGAVLQSDLVIRSAATVPVAMCDGTACADTTPKPKVVSFAFDDLGRNSSELHFPLTVTGTRRVTT